MILYERAPEPAVRAGELDLGGRRVAARATPYAGDVGAPPWRFDLVERRFARRAPGGRVATGFSDPEVWRAALGKCPGGAVLIDPCDPAEEVHAAYRAASEGAARAGRGVYLISPRPEALPGEPGKGYVALFVSLADPAAPEGLAPAAGRGFATGCVLPLIPGWTIESEALTRTVETAADSGARFVAGVVSAEDGTARRAIVEARAEIDPNTPEDFFERIHHGDWWSAIACARDELKDICTRRGLSWLPLRPVGGTEPEGNAVAAGRLEEEADLLFGRDEHRASLLRAAARWIDEWGRDLAPIVREGNFRKIFPFGDELARQAEEILAGIR